MTARRVVDARRRWLLETAGAERPVTIRGLYYMAVGAGLVPKTDRGYRSVVKDARLLRETGECPLEWIVDGARARVGSTAEPADRRPAELIGDAAAAAIEDGDGGASPWSETGIRPALVVESRAIAQTLAPVAEANRIALWPLAGQPSLSFTAELAADTPSHIGYLGDLDASGEVIRRTLRRHLDIVHGAAGYDLDDLAVTDAQVEELGLETRPGADTEHARSTGRWTAVEAEAIPASGLRRIVAGWIAGLQPDGWGERWKSRSGRARAEAEAWARERGIDV